NPGPGIARNWQLQTTLPAFIRAHDFDHPFTKQTGDTLCWQFDSLAVGDSFVVNGQMTVADSIPNPPYPLSHRSQVQAAHDTQLENNQAETMVYALARPILDCDLTLSQRALTDTTVSYQGASVPAVLTGHDYGYEIVVHNQGPAIARNWQLQATLPAWVSVQNFNRPFTTQVGDTLFWQVDSLAVGDSLLVTGQITVADSIPQHLLPLTHTSQVQAQHDTRLDNNQATTVVFALLRPVRDYDLVLSQRVLTDTTIWYQGARVPAVLAGNRYGHQMTVRNSGPASARNWQLQTTLPAQVRAYDYNRPVTRQVGDTLFWQIDSLAMGDSLIITSQITGPDSIPNHLFPLTHRSQLQATHDTQLENNQATTVVYALLRPTRDYDLALTQRAITDTSVMYQGARQPAVLAANRYRYEIRVHNRGPATARNWQLQSALPSLVSAHDFDRPFTTQIGDTLFWQIDSLAAGDSLHVRGLITVPGSVPYPLFPLSHHSRLQAPQDTELENNQAVTVVYALPRLIRDYDLALTPRAMTDTTVNYLGEHVPAVFAGNRCGYQISVSNQGPATARNWQLQTILPAQIQAFDFNRPFTRQVGDTLFWQIDSLPAGDSLLVNGQITVADSIPNHLFPLRQRSQLAAMNDTYPENNQAETVVYALLRPVRDYDLALTQRALTDTTVMFQGTRVPAVLAGNRYQYQITVYNLGPAISRNWQLQTTLHPLASAYEFNRPVTTQVGDTLFWQIDSLMAGDSLKVSGQITLTNAIPSHLFPLSHRSQIRATHDTRLENNQAETQIYALLRPIQDYDLALSQRVLTDTMVSYQGVRVPAVLAGQRYQYQITVHNQGSATARNWRLQTNVPSLARTCEFNRPVTTQVGDTLFWQVDSLAVGDSLIVIGQFTAADSIPDDFSPLSHRSQLRAANDTRRENNRAETVVYALLRPVKPPVELVDVAIGQWVQTDSMRMVGRDTLHWVQPGETFTINLAVRNLSPDTAYQVVVVTQLPAACQVHHVNPAPELQVTDSLRWQRTTLPPRTVQTFQFLATVTAPLPIGEYLYTNRVSVRARNEDPQALNNNVDVDTVYCWSLPAENAAPRIEARPNAIEVNDKVWLRVQVSVPIRRWDLKVYLANGQIDSTFADEIVASTPLNPGEWFDLTLPYTNTRLFTEAVQEEIRFELITQEFYGRIKRVTTVVQVHSSNAFELDRNVFAASREGALGIRFKLSTNRQARLEVFDIAGTPVTKIVEQPFFAGWNTYQWNGITEAGQSVGSGLYLIVLRSGDFYSYKKVIIVQ
ncbi:hypothetical protein L0128_03360, partial [candidate division KSB1 bacterium]|nr:hypothetical protein [candidate division KSB1 bacterium]